MDRRNFLKVLGITSGTAMISSCGVDKANEKIIPYVIPPEEEVYRGKPVFFSTTCSECPANCGLQVEVNEKVYHEMRGLFPTKLEGTAGHPINDGALCARGQSGLFRLYHPDRIKRPMMRDAGGNLRVVTWKEAYSKIVDEMQHSLSSGRKNLYLSGRTTGSLTALQDRFAREMNMERLPEYEVLSHANLRRANQIVFNRNAIPKYQIEKADLLLTFGADLFETFVSPVSHAAQYGKAIKSGRFEWYHIEPHVSLTGVQATKRLTIHPESEVLILSYLIHAVDKQNARRKVLPRSLKKAVLDYPAATVAERTGIPEAELRMLGTRLAAAGAPLVIAGGVSTAHNSGLKVAVLAGILQWILGMTDRTVDFAQAEEYSRVGDIHDIRKVKERLDGDEAGVIFVSNCDPVDTLPESFGMGEALGKASLTVVLSDVMTATARSGDIILPLSHSLEAWGDAMPRRGLLNIYQPAIEPQYDTAAEGDILLQLMAVKNGDSQEQSYKDYLFTTWNKQFGESAVKEMLQKGYRELSLPATGVILTEQQVVNYLQAAILPRPDTDPLLAVVPSIRTFDGRSKVLPLLSELPDPLSTISYGPWVSVPEANAEKLGLKDHDEIEIVSGRKTYVLPVKVQPLLPENVYLVQRDMIPVPETEIDSRNGEASWYVKNISVRKTGKRVAMPILSGSMDEEERGLLPPGERTGAHEPEHGATNGGMYPEHEHVNYRWGMAIDLESCIGCNACSAACYVENNIPIVGKEEHLKGREMSWIRMEPFIENGEFVEFVPMLCQQCDNAPCEPVCPVYAAYHNPEGLNVQVYNRCVGTRYCSNNCPYKVRRFNWFDHRLPEPWDKMYNPDVSVRDRGIMEKCTFCIHRIRDAKDHAKDEGRLVQDGEITPACAQTCPTDAITFGNLDDKNSRVYQLAHSDAAYRALEELGTEPAVHYLPRKKSKEEA